MEPTCTYCGATLAWCASCRGTGRVPRSYFPDPATADREEPLSLGEFVANSFRVVETTCFDCVHPAMLTMPTKYADPRFDKGTGRIPCAHRRGDRNKARRFRIDLWRCGQLPAWMLEGHVGTLIPDFVRADMVASREDYRAIRKTRPKPREGGFDAFIAAGG